MGLSARFSAKDLRRFHGTGRNLTGWDSFVLRVRGRTGHAVHTFFKYIHPVAPSLGNFPFLSFSGDEKGIRPAPIFWGMHLPSCPILRKVSGRYSASRPVSTKSQIRQYILVVFSDKRNGTRSDGFPSEERAILSYPVLFCHE